MILMQHSQEVILTKHELLQLQCLLENKICTNKIIMEYFYNQNIDISEKNIRNLIFKLRQKIPKERIVSIYGLGYKFSLT